MDSHRIIPESAGSSPKDGKNETIAFISRRITAWDMILDVGAGSGTYGKLLRGRGFQHIDAVESYEPYIEHFGLRSIYDSVIHWDIRTLHYIWYNLVIMGDVLEHLTIEDATKVIQYAQQHSSIIVVSVPYLSVQEGFQEDGSGDHLQPDLTKEVFLNRYPGFKTLFSEGGRGVFYWEQS